MAAKKTAKKAAKKTAKKTPDVAEKGGPGRPRDGRSVDELKKALAETEDADEKRKLRAKLRARGHTGGLREASGESAED